MSMRRMFTCWLTVWCVLGSLAWAAEAPAEITCSGRVVNDANEPVAGAKVTLYRFETEGTSITSASTVEQTTGQDGMFSLASQPLPSDEYQQSMVVARKDGLAMAWDNWELRQDKTATLTMGKAHTLRGIVVDDVNAPVAGAEVRIFLLVLGKPGVGLHELRFLTSEEPINLLKTLTDANGAFAFDGIPEGAGAEFVVRKQGRAVVRTLGPESYRTQKVGQFTVHDKNIRIALPSEAAIDGKVIDKATGKGVGGIQLACAQKEEMAGAFAPKPVISADDGSFRFEGLSAGTYVIRGIAPEKGLAARAVSSADATAEAGKTTSGVVVELLQGGLLEVKVTDTDKKPLAGAKVNVAPADVDRWQTLTADANGFVSVRLLPGQYRVGGVYKKNYMRGGENEEFTIEDGKTAKLEFAMKGTPKISGAIRDAAGKPVAGAEVQTIPFGGSGRVKSDANGEFEMQWNPERWSDQQVNSVLVVRHIERNLAAVVDIDEDTRKLEVTVSGGLTFAGKVLDAESKPIPGAGVTVILHTSNYGSGLGSSELRTDKNGRYEYKAIPGDMTYSIQASADGYGQSSANVDTSDAAGSRVEVEPLTLRRATMSISGVVVDANDKPVPNAEVYINGNGQQYRNSKSGADGKFTIDKLCEGRIQVNVNIQARDNIAGYMYGNSDAEAGDTDIKVTLFQPGSDGRQTSRAARRPTPLLAKPLADLTQFGLTIDPNAVKDKPILLCFVDLNQRPSRHCLSELSSKYASLAEKGVFVAGVRFGGGAIELEQVFPLGQAAEFEKTSLAWGVKALPWLVLTDSQHIVVAEGFGTSEIDEKVESLQKMQK